MKNVRATDSKKVNLVLAGLVFAVLMVFLAAEGAEAFCIYNKTDIEISATQTSNHKLFKGFTQTIPVGEKRCCDWKNKDCNKEGKQDSLVKFDVFITGIFGAHYSGNVPICQGFEITADGGITVKGNANKYSCE